MNCSRCGGMMKSEQEHFPGGQGLVEQMSCTSCGNVEDETILENRRTAMPKEFTEEQKERRKEYMRGYSQRTRKNLTEEEQEEKRAKARKYWRMRGKKNREAAKARGDKVGTARRAVRALSGAIGDRAGNGAFGESALPRATDVSAKRPYHRRGVPAVVEKEGMIFLSTAALVDAAREIRIELVYELKGAKIIKAWGKTERQEEIVEEILAKKS